MKKYILCIIELLRENPSLLKGGMKAAFLLGSKFPQQKNIGMNGR
jgi:hypothetical protein